MTNTKRIALLEEAFKLLGFIIIKMRNNNIETVILQIGDESIRIVADKENVNPKQLCESLKDYIVFCSGYDEVNFCKHHCEYSKRREITDKEYWFNPR